jgi:hypothetical protein
VIDRSGDQRGGLARAIKEIAYLFTGVGAFAYAMKYSRKIVMEVRVWKKQLR